MLSRRHIKHLERLRAYTQGQRVLALGNQVSEVGEPLQFFAAESYETIDPDGGDHRDSLTDDLPHLRQKYGAVVNIGTLEHIWDAHRAYCVSADLVSVGGHFIGHSPVSCNAMHGVHVTEWWAILRFFRLNGFTVLNAWFTNKAGATISFDRKTSAILWFIARRDHAVDDWKVPTQIYRNGKKPTPEDYLREFRDVLS